METNNLKLQVKWSKNTYEVFANPDWTILELKKALVPLTNVLPENQKFANLKQGFKLAEDNVISYYRIRFLPIEAIIGQTV
jgi:hypothetical protein